MIKLHWFFSNAIFGRSITSEGLPAPARNARNSPFSSATSTSSLCSSALNSSRESLRASLIVSAISSTH